ncbi:MAG: hypothetical protein EBU82_08635 [Flavobacteriia bacterium]|jgi:hypothetical protein|nr:hypothetical protein [Flavobacteriia bacterium]
MTHLWEMDTHWFQKSKDEYIQGTFNYKNWKDFIDCKPYKLWKPYILSSWSWKTRSLDQLKQEKRRDADKAVMDCSKMLRLNPSAYDKPTIPLDESKNQIEMLQIVFLSPDRFTGVHRVEMQISKENEDEVRDWLQRHMPTFWKLD